MTRSGASALPGLPRIGISPISRQGKPVLGLCRPTADPSGASFTEGFRTVKDRHVQAAVPSINTPPISTFRHMLTMHRTQTFLALAALLAIALPVTRNPGGIAAESSGDPSWREVRGQAQLVGRSGAGDRYPAVVQLCHGERFAVILDDPTGWSAVRLANGATVWVSSAELAEASVPCDPPPESGVGMPSSPPQTGRRPIAASDSGADTIQPAGFTLPARSQVEGTGDASQNWRPVSPRELGRSAAGTALTHSIPTTSIASGGPIRPVSPPGNLPFERPDSAGQRGTMLSTRLTLDRAEEQLTRMLARDPLTWDLRPIEELLAHLATQPLEPADISRLKSLAERVAQARQIAKDAQSAQSLAPPPLQPSPGLPPTGLGSPSIPGTMPGERGLATVIPPPGTRLSPASPPGADFGLPLEAPTQGSFGGAPTDYARGQPAKGDPGVSPASFISSQNAGTPFRPSEEGSSLRVNGETTPIPSREEIARELNELRRQRFDAVGRLVRARVRRPTDPPYMIVNERGEIEAYVKPAPGVLLRTYVGHQVGINGRKSRLPDGRGPFLVVDSVKLLDPPAVSGDALLSTAR